MASTRRKGDYYIFCPGRAYHPCYHDDGCTHMSCGRECVRSGRHADFSRLMNIIPTTVSHTFNRFVESEKAGGILLICCTIISLMLANSSLADRYLHFWHAEVAGLSVELWVNDALMAIFFLLIGLELEREIHIGELSSVRSALLPMVAAAGGIAAPALIHFALNAGTPTQPGMGIPMATDIAFALAVLQLLGHCGAHVAQGVSHSPGSYG